jgi:hypothetical protein
MSEARVAAVFHPPDTCDSALQAQSYTQETSMAHSTHAEVLEIAKDSENPTLRLLYLIYSQCIEIEHATAHQGNQSPESYDRDHPHKEM